MEHNNPNASRSYGRGRPMPIQDLRTPFAFMNTYAVEPGYVPTEGSSNGFRLNPAIVDAVRFDPIPHGEPPVYMFPAENHIHPAAVLSPVTTTPTPLPEKKFTLSPHAPEFVPRNFHPEPRIVPSQIQTNSTFDTISDSYAINELRQFLFDITLNPGNFEAKIQALSDCINDYVDDDDTLRAIVNTIFDESVRQPNLRYNGARLCKYLSDDLHISDDRVNFKQLLLQRCCQEHKRRDYLSKADDGGTYLRGFAMYLAELYSQLEFNGQRINILGENLIWMLDTLLSNSSSDNLKSACQILKLVGVYLEDIEKKAVCNTIPDLENIFTLMKQYSENEDYPRDIRSMMSSVVELRLSDWGRATEKAEQDSEEQHIPATLNEPVMYGPDGKPITAEESLFLHSQYSNHASDPEEYDAYEESNYEEMGEDMQAAYEVFLNEMPHC